MHCYCNPRWYLEGCLNQTAGRGPVNPHLYQVSTGLALFEVVLFFLDKGLPTWLASDNLSENFELGHVHKD